MKSFILIYQVKNLDLERVSKVDEAKFHDSRGGKSEIWMINVILSQRSLIPAKLERWWRIIGKTKKRENTQDSRALRKFITLLFAWLGTVEISWKFLDQELLLLRGTVAGFNPDIQFGQSAWI